MKKYCCGFLFDHTLDSVVLIKKNRPNFLAGKLNAVGGKLEENETPLEAMVREFEEEAGVKIEKWKFLDTLTDGETFCVWYYYSISTLPLSVKQMTDEEVIIVAVDELHEHNVDKDSLYILELLLKKIRINTQ